MTIQPPSVIYESSFFIATQSLVQDIYIYKSIYIVQWAYDFEMKIHVPNDYGWNKTFNISVGKHGYTLDKLSKCDLRKQLLLNKLVLVTDVIFPNTALHLATAFHNEICFNNLSSCFNLFLKICAIELIYIWIWEW